MTIQGGKTQSCFSFREHSILGFSDFYIQFSIGFLALSDHFHEAIALDINHASGIIRQGILRARQFIHRCWLCSTSQARLAFLEQQFGGSLVQCLESTLSPPFIRPTVTRCQYYLVLRLRRLMLESSSKSVAHFHAPLKAWELGICVKRISKRYLRVASGEKPSRAGPSKAWESSQLLAQPWWPIDALTLASNFSNSASVSRFGCSLPPKALCNSMLHWETESTIWKSWWATLPINMQTRLDRPLICASQLRHEKDPKLAMCSHSMSWWSWCARTTAGSHEAWSAPRPPHGFGGGISSVCLVAVFECACTFVNFLLGVLDILVLFCRPLVRVLVRVLVCILMNMSWWSFSLLPLLLLSFVSTLLLSSHLQSEDLLSIRLLGQPWKAWSRITVLLCPRRPGACHWSNV